MKGSQQKEAEKGAKNKLYKIKADFSYLSSYKYRIEKQVGRGGYGVVYKARDIVSERDDYAIKINFNTVSRELIYAQMAFLILVKNRENLPKLVNIFVHHDITHIVLRYFNFKPFITFFNTFTLEDAKHYLFQLLIALKNLKQLGIYHRDVKPGNFLYNPDTRRGLLIDFGLAELDPTYVMKLTEKLKGNMGLEEDHLLNTYNRLLQCIRTIGRNKIGTETYMPLESILRHSEQSYQSDIWPVGVILLQFVLRKYNVFNNVRMINKPANCKNNYYINYIIEMANLFGSKEVIEQCQQLQFNLKLPKDIPRFQLKDIARIEGYDNITEDLLKQLLNLNHLKRITVENAMLHPFFDSVRNQHTK